MRVGLGKDIHILKKGYDLILGGTKIPFKKGLVSYSDGDCLIHSIIDAILGALSLGDIGQKFPDNDPKYKGISSLTLLKETKKFIDESNYKISNIDCFISCEKPKLKDYINEMKINISDILDINLDQISIKAGTNEKMGYIGRSKAIECESIVLLEEK